MVSYYFYSAHLVMENLLQQFLLPAAGKIHFQVWPESDSMKYAKRFLPLFHRISSTKTGWGIGLWFIVKTMIYCIQEQWFVNVKDGKSIDSHCKILTA